MLNLHGWSDYIIRKCLFLSALFLMAAAALSVTAESQPELYPALRHYINRSATFSAVVFAAGTVGSLLLEEGLGRLSR